MQDRVEAVCDLLMAAAYADQQLHDNEILAVQAYLESLLPDGQLSPALAMRMNSFKPEEFELALTLEVFAGESKEDRKKLLDIVAAIHAADDEYDFDEDAFLLELTAGLGLSDEDALGHALDYQVETLQESLAALRTGPPPAPR